MRNLLLLLFFLLFIASCNLKDCEGVILTAEDITSIRRLAAHGDMDEVRTLLASKLNGQFSLIENMGSSPLAPMINQDFVDQKFEKASFFENSSSPCTNSQYLILANLKGQKGVSQFTFAYRNNQEEAFQKQKNIIEELMGDSGVSPWMIEEGIYLWTLFDFENATNRDVDGITLYRPKSMDKDAAAFGVRASSMGDEFFDDKVYFIFLRFYEEFGEE